MKIRLVRAAIADAEIIYRMQRQAFAELLEKYRDYDTSPGNEPFEKVKSRIEQPYTFFYLIKSDETVVGAIRGTATSREFLLFSYCRNIATKVLRKRQ